MGGPLALDGRRLMGGHNNQPKVVVNSEGGVREETRPGRNVWGSLSHCLGWDINQQKNREMGGPFALDGRRLMGGHNNQPKVGINGGGGVG